MKKGKFLLLVGLLCFAGSAVASQAVPCEVDGYQALIGCMERNSLPIKLAEQQLRSAAKLEGVARQWLNPDLDIEATRKDKDKSETSVALLFPIRLGGKRSAQIGEALAELEKSQAKRDLDVEAARLALMLSLHRLTQLKNEIHIEEESISTFSKIVSQFQSKPALAPEQEVSLSVFKMATADHRLTLAKLRTEEEGIYRNISAISGVERSAVEKNLPSRRGDWPILSAKRDAMNSPQVRGALGDVKLAESHLSIADADAWPDLRIGPMLKAGKDNGVAENMIGLGLSFPLPIFSLNGAAKSHAAEKLSEAQLAYDTARISIKASRENFVKKYENTVEALKNTLSTKTLHDDHERIERLFFRGIVSSSLVIEAHRQLFELESKRNEAERDAIEALGMVHIIDNTFSGVIL